jgi:hypothetical protein
MVRFISVHGVYRRAGKRTIEGLRETSTGTGKTLNGTDGSIHFSAAIGAAEGHEFVVATIDSERLRGRFNNRSGTEASGSSAASFHKASTFQHEVPVDAQRIIRVKKTIYAKRSAPTE